MIETAEAHAKINLSLDIVSKMDDGYHYLRTIMTSVSLCDRVTVECVPGEGVSVETGSPFVQDNDRNIAVKAANAFLDYTGIMGYRIHVIIDKVIPVCAGLGGGSTDGACVLRLLDKMLDSRLGTETLELIGRSVGSDVPFCVSGGIKLCEGRGDVMTELPSLPECCFVVYKPPISFSTPELYKRVNCKKIGARPDTDGIITAIERGDLTGIARRIYNVFEDVLPRGLCDITEIKSRMLDYGAVGAVMTGSGSAVAGLFSSKDEARNAWERLDDGSGVCHLAEAVGSTQVMFSQKPV